MPEATALFRLDGQRALVTGAARGIGLEIARLLGELGARVALADRLPLEAARASVGAAAVSTHDIDLRDTASCEAAVGAAGAALGGLDLLVNNAGIIDHRPAHEIDDDTWSRIIDTNLTGTFRICRAAHGALAAAGTAGRGPAVVNLSSGVSKYATPNNAHYSVSKAGINHLTRLLALEWAGAGVRVNAVAPTVVPTDMSAGFRADPASVAVKLAQTPLGRFASATEIAAAVAFLLAPAAAMITGQVLFVDGGCSIK
jgi:NAD(P)-dependent dehydrogenase (short-subunit alcohol dehydrogenase family)